MASLEGWRCCLKACRHTTAARGRWTTEGGTKRAYGSPCVAFVVPAAAISRSFPHAFLAHSATFPPMAMKGLKTMRNFPAPKRGKIRNASRTAKGRKHAKDDKVYRKVLYVRSGAPTRPVRRIRNNVTRTVTDFLAATDRQVVTMLVKDGILRKRAGDLCPRCKGGRLGPLALVSSRGRLFHRCSRKGCQAYVAPHGNHPIFNTANGRCFVRLQDQAAALLCAVQGSPQTLAHSLFGFGEKFLRTVCEKNDKCRAAYVEAKEKDIVFGEGMAWKDVEADEVDLRGNLVDGAASEEDDEAVEWEQWGGVVERGAPHTLLLTRLQPKKTKKGAHGPGPIRIPDWVPIAEKYLMGRKVILHTDGARTYSLKVDGVLHDHVVHQKKPLKVGDKLVRKSGRLVWITPQYVRLFTHRLPGGRRLKVKGGTQVIDKAWQHLRDAIKRHGGKVGSQSLRVRIRSAQWTYWNRGKDPWAATGQMIRALRG